VAQSECPEFKPQYHKKKEKEKAAEYFTSFASAQYERFLKAISGITKTPPISPSRVYKSKFI
jgi:hypothetical protein